MAPSESNAPLEPDSAKLTALDPSSFLRQVIDLVPHYIFAKDTEGRFVLVNRALADAYGSTVEEIIGKTDADFAKSPEEAANFRKDDLEVINTGTPKLIEAESITDAQQRMRVLQTTKIPFTFAGTTRPGLLGIAIDITEGKETERKIEFLAHHDYLTGLPNRSRLEPFLNEPLATNETFCLLFIDLDYFKHINDSLGHAVGDAFLQTIAGRIREALPPHDFVCRAGGDEFIVVLRSTDRDQVQARAQQLLDVISDPILVDSMSLSSSCSIGISVAPEDGTSVGTLMKHADSALYAAKARGRNTVQRYTQALNAAAGRRLAMYNGLRTAAKQKELDLLFQPIVHAHSRAFVSVEALLRWKSKELGSVSPAEFIPLAEETGLVGALGDWVIEETFRTQEAWSNEGLDLNVSINISARQLLQPGFEKHFRELCSASGARLDRLTLELTEGVFLTDAEAARKILASLADSGAKVSIDDFGVGYSSLNYLRRLPLSYLKIDRSFVQDCTQNAEDASIIRTILALAKNLRLGVVAEGVETESQAEFLRNEGCDLMQGYLFARPLSAREIARVLHHEVARLAPAGS
jgi:diguanylate cyclase (GGDEF)-like protein/PAS domain S-box-containing protein